MTARRERAKRVLSGEEVEDIDFRSKRAMTEVFKMNHDIHPERNPIRRLKLYKQYSADLIDTIHMLQEAIRVSRSMEMMETPNDGLKWTEPEDDVLYTMRADGKQMHVIANILGRTPSACATRLSILTGIPRSEIVEAYIDGTLDELPVKGLFQGRVKRVAQ